MGPLLLLLGALLVVGCGGGSGQAAAPAIARIEPSALFARESSAVRLIGNGFGKRGGDVVLRLTALSGTPFNDGSSDTFETSLEVESDVQIRGDIAATHASEATEATLSLHYPGGGVIDGGGLRLLIHPQTVDSFTPPSAGNASIGQPFVITGTGFRPPNGLVTVRFEAVSGTPFLGGAQPMVPTSGIVTSPTTIGGLFPSAAAAVVADAYVTVVLPSGGEITSNPSPLVTFQPTPTIVAFNPSIVTSSTAPPFSIVGAAFGSAGNPATVTLLADSGTPFLGGTSGSLLLSGTVQGGTLIDGTFVDPDASFATLAFVKIDLPGGSSVTSAAPLVQILPAPVLTSISPNAIETGASVSYVLTGANFTPMNGLVGLSFQADSGTPFNGGTSSSLTVTGTIVSSTQIAGTLPDPIVNADATCSVSGVFPSGATATSPPGILFIESFSVPVFDPSFGATISGVTNSDDSFAAVSFTGGFTFPFYGTNHSSCFVGSNGFLSFVSGTSDLSESSSDLLSQMPRIALLWDDLNPGAAGDIFFKQLSDRAVVTWSNVPEFSNTGSNTFQAVLYGDGRIDLHFSAISAPDGLTGISPGGGAGGSAVDCSATLHPTRSTLTPGIAMWEIWTSGCDLDPGWIYYLPLPAGGFEWASGP